MFITCRRGGRVVECASLENPRYFINTLIINDTCLSIDWQTTNQQTAAMRQQNPDIERSISSHSDEDILTHCSCLECQHLSSGISGYMCLPAVVSSRNWHDVSALLTPKILPRNGMRKEYYRAEITRLLKNGHLQHMRNAFRLPRRDRSPVESWSRRCSTTTNSHFFDLI